MIEVKSYIDTINHITQVYYVKKIKEAYVDLDEYAYDNEYYDIIEKEYFRAYIHEDNESFYDNDNDILYKNLDYELVINIDKTKINQIIAKILNSILDSSINIEIDDDTRFIVQSSVVCECDEDEEISIGDIKRGIIRFVFDTEHENTINIDEIKKYLSEIAKYRVRFEKRDSKSIEVLILPLDKNEMVDILKRYFVVKRIITI